MTSIDDVINNIGEGSRDIRGIREKHKAIMRDYTIPEFDFSSVTDSNFENKYKEFEDNLADFYKQYMHEVDGSDPDKIPDYTARNKVRQLYKAGTEEDLRAAFSRAKETGEGYDKVFEIIGAVIENQEKNSYVDDNLIRNIGDDFNKQKQFVAEIRKRIPNLLPNDLNDNVLAGKYKEVGHLYTTLIPQLKDKARKALYN